MSALLICWYAVGWANLGIFYRRYRLDWSGIKTEDLVICFGFAPITFICLTFHKSA